MGKEVKIGLAIIFILTITFGVVLAKRLTESSDSPPVAAAGTKDHHGPEAKGQLAAKDPIAKTTHRIAQRPTVVTANDPSGKPPKSSPEAVSQWNVAAHSGQADQGPDYETAPSPYWPKVTMPVSVDPDDRYGSAEQSAQGSQTYDPFRHRRAQTAAAGTAEAGQMDQTSNTLRVIGPPPRPSPRLDSGGYDSSRYQQHYHPDDSTIEQTSPYRQMASYGQSPRRDNSSASSMVQQRDASGDLLDDASQYGTAGLLNESGEYKVQPNDSYWVISQKLYGSGAYFKALAAHNNDNGPWEGRLQVGDTITAPSLAELEKAYPDLCPKASRRQVLQNRALAVSTRRQFSHGRTYTVEEGDTLFDIARYELGKASRWIEIHQLNRDVLGDDYDYLTPGTELILPDDNADNSSDSITRRPGAESIYQR